MKNKPVIIDSPNSKNTPKIFGNLCGKKPRSKTRDFDDFFEPGEKSSLLSNEILSKLHQYLQSNPLPSCPDPLKYALVEDLYIIWIKSKGISNTLSSRSDPSIKSRFYKRLRVLTNHDLQEIFYYVDENGINNKHLVFTKQGGFQGIRDGNKIVLLDDEEKEEDKDNKENLKENQENMEEEENFRENKEEELEIEENEEEIYFEEKCEKMEENLKENHEEIEENHEEIEENPEEIQENPEKIEPNPKKMEENPEEIEENPHEIEQIEENPAEIKEENKLYVETEQFRESPMNICCRTLSLLSGLNNTTKLPILISKENDVNPIEKFEKITIIKDFSSNNREFLAGVSSESIRVLLDLRSVFHRNIRIILQDLQKVSGNLEDLIEFYTDEENREHLLWNSEEDQLLEDLMTGKETSLKLLIKYKGIERVKNRMRFKGLKKNFEF